MGAMRLSYVAMSALLVCSDELVSAKAPTLSFLHAASTCQEQSVNGQTKSPMEEMEKEEGSETSIKDLARNSFDTYSPPIQTPDPNKLAYNLLAPP